MRLPVDTHGLRTRVFIHLHVCDHAAMYMDSFLYAYPFDSCTCLFIRTHHDGVHIFLTVSFQACDVMRNLESTQSLVKKHV
jgi:hypothetical protein